MKKLTDAIVAKALGFKPEPGNPKWLMNPARPRDEFFTHITDLPHFTTSLDAIVAEIEMRRLWWLVSHSEPNRGDFYAQVEGKLVGTPRGLANAKTAPLALCASLLAYLKDHHD